MSVMAKQERASGAAAATTRQNPAWFEEYRASYQAGVAHAFIISGDIDGLAFEDSMQRALLLSKLGESREVVAVWHLASGGVTLYNADDEMFTDTGTRIGTRREIATAILQPPGSAPAAQKAGGVAALTAAAGPQASQADPFKQAAQPLQALALLQALLTEGRSTATKRGNVAVVIDYADALVPAPAMAGEGRDGAGGPPRAGHAPGLGQGPPHRPARQPGLLLCRDRAELHPDLLTSDSGWRSIVIPPPDREARREFLDWYLAVRERRQKPIALLERLTSAEVANLTAGLNLRNLEDILLTAYGQGGLTRALLKLTKDRIISAEYSAVAEMIDPLPGGFRDIGGVEVFKSYCERRIMTPLRKGKLENVPRGMMLVGPPGTGKTYGLRALAGEISFTAVALNIAKIMGGIVGESERNLATFLGFCRALAPCIIFIDEFDQTEFSQRGDQSGNPVAKNMFGALLQFMSDETLRGKVIVIFASNRPDKIDPAMKRSGRIDAIVPMLLPERDDRHHDRRRPGQVAGLHDRRRGAGAPGRALGELERGRPGGGHPRRPAARRGARHDPDHGGDRGGGARQHAAERPGCRRTVHHARHPGGQQARPAARQVSRPQRQHRERRRRARGRAPDRRGRHQGGSVVGLGTSCDVLCDVLCDEKGQDSERDRDERADRDRERGDGRGHLAGALRGRGVPGAAGGRRPAGVHGQLVDRRDAGRPRGAGGGADAGGPRGVPAERPPTARRALRRAIYEWANNRAGTAEFGEDDLADANGRKKLIREIKARADERGQLPPIVYALVEELSLGQRLGLQYATAYRFRYDPNLPEAGQEGTNTGRLAVLMSQAGGIGQIAAERERDRVLAGDHAAVGEASLALQRRGPLGHPDRDRPGRERHLGRVGVRGSGPAGARRPAHRAAGAAGRPPAGRERVGALPGPREHRLAAHPPRHRRRRARRPAGRGPRAGEPHGQLRGGQQGEAGSVKPTTMAGFVDELLGLQRKAKVYVETVGLRDERVDRELAAIGMRAVTLNRENRDLRQERLQATGTVVVAAQRPGRRATSARNGTSAGAVGMGWGKYPPHPFSRATRHHRQPGSGWESPHPASQEQKG
jgi:transitional endoplasmic reticulum ATPase